MKRQETIRKSKKKKAVRDIKLDHKPWATLSISRKIRDVKRVLQQDYANNLLEGWTQENIQQAKNSAPFYVETYPTYDSPGSIVRLIVEERLLKESSSD